MRAEQKISFILLALMVLGVIALSWFCVPATHHEKEISDAISFVDQNGGQVNLKSPAKRMVILPIPMASMAMAIDLSADKICGINPALKSDMLEDGILWRMFPSAKSIPTDVAGDNFAPSAEALAREKPDLVMQWGGRDIKTIRALGLPVLSFKYEDSLLAAEWMTMIGEVLGKPERAKKMADWFMRRVNEIGALAATIPETKKPTVIYLSRSHHSMIVAGSKSSTTFDIHRAGGINLAAQMPPSSTVDQEQLLVWDPDIVILNNYGRNLTPEDFYHNPLFAHTKSVKRRQIYSSPKGGFGWASPSQETPLATEWLFKIFHPDRAKETGDLRASLKTAYQFLYGYEVSEAEIDEILQLDKNAKSARYTELFGRNKTIDSKNP